MVCVCAVCAVCVLCVLCVLCFVDCRVEYPKLVKLSPLNICGEGTTRGHQAHAKHCIVETVFHMCLDPSEDANKAISQGGGELGSFRTLVSGL